MQDVGIFNGRFVYHAVIWYFCGHLVYFMVIWYIFSRFGMLYQENSGNPGMYMLKKCGFHNSYGNFTWTNKSDWSPPIVTNDEIFVQPINSFRQISFSLSTDKTRCQPCLPSMYIHTGWPDEFVFICPYLLQLIHIFISGKSSKRIRAISVIFIKRPKINNDLICW
jgi:hypothetical protein